MKKTIVVCLFCVTILLAGLPQDAHATGGFRLQTSHKTLTILDYSADSPPPPTEWNTTFGAENTDKAFSSLQTTDGGYALAGETQSYGAGYSDFWLVKTDAAGNVLWNRTYGGSGADRAYSLVETSDGGYAVAGQTASSGSGGYDFWLVKTEASGNAMWNHTYGGPNHDIGHSVITTSDGGYAVVGDVSSYGAGGYDFWLVKTDAAGNPVWNHTYGGVNSDFAWSLVQTEDDGYAIGGYTKSYGDGLSDFWLVKTDAAGNVMWNKTYGGPYNDDAHSLVQTDDGGYALAGYTASFGAGNYDSWLVKTDAAGNPVWNHTYGGLDNDIVHSLVQTSDEGYALAGDVRSYGAGGYDAWLIKTDTAGNALWNQTHGGANNDFAWSLLQTVDQGYSLAGYTASYGAGAEDFWLIKVEAEVGVEIHDVAVTDVASSKTVVGQGYVLNINVTVTNQGDYSETFNVTAYANTTAFGTETVTLETGNSTTIPFTWNTLTIPYGNYTISAVADTVPSETDTDDNTHIDGTVCVTITGDVNGDGTVDASDLFHLSKAYGCAPRDDNWNPNCDCNNDDKVDKSDLTDLNKNYGKTI